MKNYADEATLTSRLEKLLSVEPTDEIGTTYIDTKITPANLVAGHQLTNEELLSIGLSQLPPLPNPKEAGENPYEELLAVVLTTVIRLVQSSRANKSLREKAEAGLRDVNIRKDALSRKLSFAEERLKKKDVQIQSMRNSYEETLSKHHYEVRRLSTEMNQLRSRLLHASHRENQLVLSAKKREKEFGQLQARVHALFKSGLSIDPRITRVGMRPSPKVVEEAHDRDLEEMGEERVSAVEGENDVMRGLLQAIQEELDDLIVSYDGSEVSEELDVAPAPGEEVMQLPYEVIAEEVQEALEKKFAILRKALARGVIDRGVVTGRDEGDLDTGEGAYGDDHVEDDDHAESDGDDDAEEDVSAESDVGAEADPNIGGAVNANEDVEAERDVNAENDVNTNENVNSEENVKMDGDVIVQGAVNAEKGNNERQEVGEDDDQGVRIHAKLANVTDPTRSIEPVEGDIEPSSRNEPVAKRLGSAVDLNETDPANTETGQQSDLPATGAMISEAQ